MFRSAMIPARTVVVTRRPDALACNEPSVARPGVPS